VIRLEHSLSELLHIHYFQVLLTYGESIVFCHALTRSWRDTWRDTQTQRPWPETFLPGDSTSARILVYDADPIRLWNELSEQAMMDYSKKLLEELAHIRQRTTTVSSVSFLSQLLKTLLIARHSGRSSHFLGGS
jgi:hypothetical protein